MCFTNLLNPRWAPADRAVMEAAPSPWRRLGRLLVEDGLITEDQLDRALENQVRTRRLLGDILIELGYVSADDVGRALASQAALASGERAVFGTGLRSELERRGVDQPQPAPMLHLVIESAEEPDAPDPGHVLMVQLPTRYVLVDRSGEVPPSGSTLELPEVAEGTFRVEAVGRSPYPDDPRPCAFALRMQNSAL